MDDQEMRFRLLLSEKEYFDSRIKSYTEHHSTIFGTVFIGGGAAVGGLVAGFDSQRLSAQTLGVALPIVVVAGCCAILQMISNYALALEFIQRKAEQMSSALSSMLQDPQGEAGAKQLWQTTTTTSSLIRAAISGPTVVLLMCHFLGSAAVLRYAATLSGPTWLLGATSLLLLTTGVCEAFLASAFWSLGRPSRHQRRT